MAMFGRRKINIPRKGPSDRTMEQRKRQITMIASNNVRSTAHSETKNICHALVLLAFVISLFLWAITTPKASTEISILDPSSSSSLHFKNAPSLNSMTRVKTITTTVTNNGYDEQLQYPSSDVYIAGIILDAKNTHKPVWKTIVNLNCKYGYGIHILVKKGLDHAMAMRYKFYNILLRDTDNGEKNETSCGPFVVHSEDSIESSSTFGPKYASLFLNSHTNRIDRISMMRDYHRSLLRSLFSIGPLLSGVKDVNVHDRSNNTREKEGVVLLLDFDLHGTPNAATLSRQIERLQQPSYPHDVICAAGITRARRNQLWYYDTFSTVMLPDTFIHPLKRRLIPYLYLGEDSTHVRSDNMQGEVTQGGIMEYFRSEGKKTDSGAVRVKSCFGGLALYRAGIYFTRSCQYQLDATFVKLNRENQSSIMRYANSVEERPCEHVVFHDCLENVVKQGINIALNPELRTIWGRNR